ncbi:MAG: cation transporter [Bacteroidales bacterium]|nr:cation transporter [Bacteroidales bacterium]
MKKIDTLLLVFACITSMGFAQKPKKAEKKKETVEIRLDDMCSSCVNKINSYIAFEKGVTALDINQERSSVNVTYWANRTDTTQLRKAFTKVKMNIEEMKMVDETKEDGEVKK